MSGEGEVGAAGQLSALGAECVDLPDRPDPFVEERDGKEKCQVFYRYPAEKGDRVACTFVDDEQGFRIVFSVKRLNSEKTAYLHRTKVFPSELRENLVITNQCLEVKKNMCVVKLKKKRTNFNVTTFYRPDSPPA